MYLACKMMSLRSQILFNLISNNNPYLLICQRAAICTTINKKLNINLSRSDISKLNNSLQNVNQRFASNEPLPKYKDVFGDLSYNYHQKTEMDKNEEAEERFTENESALPRRYLKTPGYYTKLIQSYINKMDLEKAIGILDLMRSNRDKPIAYHFCLIMRAYAINGDIKNCFRYFNKMKKCGLKPYSSSYTSLITSVAHCKNTEKAMEHLYHLRKMFLQTGVRLNQIHYNALVTAYGRHGKVKEAFSLIDEMKDKKVPITLNTFNVLLNSAISLKHGGLKLALLVWQMMKHYNIKPDLTTYNLLLRSIRDTDLGDLKVDDVLVNRVEDSRITFVEFGRPNLLATPPVVTMVALDTTAKNSEKDNNKKEEKSIVKLSDDVNLPSKCEESIDLVIPEKVQVNLNEIHKQNKLILFGGLENILKMMENDGISPNARTMTYFIELTPNSVAIEKLVIDKCRKMNIQLDVQFFNILMKKRCYRYDYDSARNVLKDMEIFNLYPDCVTWGTLALTCNSPAEIKTFMETMESIGFEPNDIIIGILMVKASRFGNKAKFEALIDLMKYSLHKNIKPTKLTLDKIDQFHRDTKESVKHKHTGTRTKTFKEDYEKYIRVYEKWRLKLGSAKIVHES